MGTLTILVVDDEEAMRETLGDILTELGHEVVVARDGREAISLVDENVIDVALIDVRMPGLDGVETFLRITARHPGFPAYLITGHATTEQVSKAKDGGILGVMHKPLDIHLLVATLDPFQGAPA